MILLAEGLFRLDVVISGDTLRTVVRNLSSGDLNVDRESASDSGASLAFGEIATYEPGRAGLEFTLGRGGDRVGVKVTSATLRFPERGTVRVTAQAIVRPAPAL